MPYPVGRKIVAVRRLTDQELDEESWVPNAGQSVVAVVLDDGSFLYPSADYEGNGPGAIFCSNASGDTKSIITGETDASHT